jgi:hypothetical protein
MAGQLVFYTALQWRMGWRWGVGQAVDIRLARISRPVSPAISACLVTGLFLDEIKGDVCPRRNCVALFRVFACCCC